MLLTGCDWFRPEPIFVEPEIPDELTRPCPRPVKGPPTEGALAELALGWKSTALCNADKLESIRHLTAS
jgi:hypothetical protein